MEKAPPEFIVKLAGWLEDLNDAQNEEDWDGVGSVAEAIKDFLATHEATGPGKVFGDEQGTSGG